MVQQILSGIAAQAADGRVLGTKRRVEYRSLPSKSILNRCANPEMPFRWTVNPYRGCEIGCHYCYAVYTHQYLGIDDPSQFASLVFSKENAKNLLRRELAKGISGAIAVGTGTDPYQPAERRFETTRGVLEAFAEFSGNVIGITTKSDLERSPCGTNFTSPSPSRPWTTPSPEPWNRARCVPTSASKPCASCARR